MKTWPFLEELDVWVAQIYSMWCSTSNSIIFSYFNNSTLDSHLLQLCCYKASEGLAISIRMSGSQVSPSMWFSHQLVTTLFWVLLCSLHLFWLFALLGLCCFCLYCSSYGMFTPASSILLKILKSHPLFISLYFLFIVPSKAALVFSCFISLELCNRLRSSAPLLLATTSLCLLSAHLMKHSSRPCFVFLQLFSWGWFWSLPISKGYKLHQRSWYHTDPAAWSHHISCIKVWLYKFRKSSSPTFLILNTDQELIILIRNQLQIADFAEII